MSNVPQEMKKITDYVWELPVSYKKGMNVPARIYTSKKLLDAMDRGVFDQVSNVACLPGIQNYAFCMPDGHWGYEQRYLCSPLMDFRLAVLQHLTWKRE